MHQLSSEILLMLFKIFDTKEMVKGMRVCKEWMEIIDGNKTLWRRLILPNKGGGWHPSVVELFDRKSNSTLEEVVINTYLESQEETDMLMDLLERSKESLQVLHLCESYFFTRAILSDLSWKLPCLFDCRFPVQSTHSPVKLLRARVEKKEEEEFQPSSESTRKLKILSIDSSGSLDILFKLQRQRLDCLGSFNLTALASPTLLQVLADSSQSLKHLGIWLDNEKEDKWQQQQLSKRALPALKVLEIACRGEEFPSWLEIPPSATIICYGPTLFDFPRVSELWLARLYYIGRLRNRCPDLVNLRADPYLVPDYTNGFSSDECDGLVSMLRERQDNISAGMEIEGVKMIPIKCLVVPVAEFNQDQLSQLRELVEEVVDLETVDRFVEVEI